MPNETWHDELNARAYHEFAISFPLYRISCERLLAVPEAATATSILDLACGTGVSTRAIVEACPSATQIIGIDSSLQQIEIARTQDFPVHVQFIHCGAEDVHLHVDIRFDLIICNAAFWYFDPIAVLSRCDKLVGPSSCLAFNLPPENPAPCTSEHSENHDLISNLVKIAASECGVRPEGRSADSQRRGTDYRRRLFEGLADSAFNNISSTQFLYTDTIRERLAWLSVPLFWSFYNPGLSYGVAMKAIQKAQTNAALGSLAITRILWTNYWCRRS